MIRKYHDVAKENKSIVCWPFEFPVGDQVSQLQILSHVGVESTPQDLLAFCAVLELKNKLNLATKEVVCAINDYS